MKHLLWITITTIGFLTSCGEKEAEANEENTTAQEHAEEGNEPALALDDPHGMLKDAYQLFKEGNDEESISVAEQVLQFGRETQNDTLIGGALSSLCRNAQRSLDTARLGELSEELVALAESSGNKIWLMKRAHMNAEMWRLIGNLDRAEKFYEESMSISFEIDQVGMYTIDHFNKSFVATAKGDYEMARSLLTKYYDLRELHFPESAEDPYGLIALSYILEQEQDYEGAHQVAVVTRRIFEEENIFPEPPDEKPLIAVEEKVKTELAPAKWEQINRESGEETVGSLLEKYLK